MRCFDVLLRLRAVGLGVSLAGLMLVSGCGGVSKISSPFGAGDEDNSTGYASERLPEKLPDMAEAPATNPDGGTALNCPQVVAWPNERLRTLYQSGHDGDQLYVVHRGEITKLSRECRFMAGQVVVKYGFAGRVLLGPKGRPGPVSMPVTIRAAGANKSTLATDRMSITATVPPNNPVGYFSMVREISFPIQVGTRPEDYKIFVSLK